MKRMNFPKRKDKLREEAAARQEAYKPDPTRYGLRQRVKHGLVHPLEDTLPVHAARIVGRNARLETWLMTTGMKRYKGARRSK